MFKITNGKPFWENFEEVVKVFQDKTKDLPPEKMFGLIEDPGKHIFA